MEPNVDYESRERRGEAYALRLERCLMRHKNQKDIDEMEGVVRFGEGLNRD